MAEALLEVHNLSRRFAAVDALKQVNFCVEAGEVHALIGPNGAGKTTFIHHVSGADGHVARILTDACRFIPGLEPFPL